MHVLIVGGGIGGLATALSLHDVGIRCTVFEQVRELRCVQRCTGSGHVGGGDATGRHQYYAKRQAA